VWYRNKEPRTRRRGPHYPASQAGNRAIEHRDAPCLLAEFQGNLQSQPRVCRRTHHPQRLLDLCLGDKDPLRRQNLICSQNQ
jgi:hypothetical protein